MLIIKEIEKSQKDFIKIPNYFQVHLLYIYNQKDILKSLLFSIHLLILRCYIFFNK